MLVGLAHAAQLGWLSKNSGRVQVVDSRSEEAGPQSEAQHLVWPQQQLVLTLAHPGKQAVELLRLRAAKEHTKKQIQLN